MKRIQKYLYWVIATILFGAIVVLGAVKGGDLPRFLVTCDGHTEVVSTYNAKDGNYHVFLPAHAALEDIIVDVPPFQSITLDGKLLTSGMDCSSFQPETPYELNYKRTAATLWFHKSENVGTVYINTVSGNLDRFENDKSYEEIASLCLYTAEGRLNCLDEYTTLKGRGNGTWALDKRPYSLSLSGEADLLGMGCAKNWVLLANAYDETNLNNKLVLDMAKEVGFLWSPDSAFVDVYLNGQYNGLYLLTEKVETAPNRLEIDPASGDFLCKVDLYERWDTLRNPFVTEQQRIVEITSPQRITSDEKAQIEARVNQLEQWIFSGEDLDQNSGFDLDSWVRRYLIDEISANIDADLASSYFYYADGIFYAGPVWDYDIALGNNTRNQNPHAFIARNRTKSDVHISEYYPALYRNPIFYQRMTEVYATEFLPYLEQLLQGGIESLAREISTAANINSIRWGYMYEMHRQEQFHPVSTVEDLIRYLEERVAFLSSAWLDGREFCTLQFERVPGQPYWNISVEKGSLLETELIDLTLWMRKDTGEVFDPEKPIAEDMILTLQQPPTEEAESVYWEEAESSPIYALCFISIAGLLGMFLTLTGMDILQRHRERRHSGEKTKVSP